MNPQIFDAGGEIAFFKELKMEIEVCRQQIDALTAELSTQRDEFRNYQRDSDAKLSELQQDKEMLGREVVALRMQFIEGGNGAMAKASHNARNIEISSKGSEQTNTVPVSIKSENPEDEKVKSFRRSMEENNIKMKSEEIITGEKSSSVRKSSSSKRSLGSNSAKDRIMRQRLVLLRHASQCNAPEGTCKFSRHCAKTKAVWNHIMIDGCNKPNCTVQHCVSSRYVLKNRKHFKPTLSRSVTCVSAKESFENNEQATHQCSI